MDMKLIFCDYKIIGETQYNEKLKGKMKDIIYLI